MMKIGNNAAFTWEDANRAQEEWGANCGPGAVALMLGWTLDEIRPYMGDFEKKTLHQHHAHAPGAGQYRRHLEQGQTKVNPDNGWPEFGLVRIQWHGPWMNHWAGKQRHTHWVGAATCQSTGTVLVFDINTLSEINETGGCTLDRWRMSIVPWILQHCEPKADGKWSITHAIELDLR